LKLHCPSCPAEVVVIRAAPGDIALACGGTAMAAKGAGPAAKPASDEGVLLGKRYSDAETGLEVLCTRSGAGPLSVGGRELPPLAAKPLPASD
jgi:hypothetical protein